MFNGTRCVRSVLVCSGLRGALRPTELARTPLGSELRLTFVRSFVRLSKFFFFAGILAQEHLRKVFENRNRYFRGDGGIGAAPRLAAAHRGAGTNAPGGDLNQTPGESACV